MLIIDRSLKWLTPLNVEIRRTPTAQGADRLTVTRLRVEQIFTGMKPVPVEPTLHDKRLSI
ncbi:MAG: hypothetical protein HGA57_09240 [Chlorobium limicola]|uniref:hypothetical protein n=1 Tax=Chlorobium limicola TaxID=1092 RepID=UPI0023F23AD7|nr:hypothetical protein [Chlorobium limicola]NTV21548.1 hypothetical protein [Chlorobium limicola]